MPELVLRVGDRVILGKGGIPLNYSGPGTVAEIRSNGFMGRNYRVELDTRPLNQQEEWFPLNRLKLEPLSEDVFEEVAAIERLSDDPDLEAAAAMLAFETGATRNRKENELQYEGFLSPLALQMFAEYMHANRVTADGSIRDSDNWQKGMPDESYRDSLLRHVMDIWMIYRGWRSKARDGGDKRKALAGAFFNLQGLMHNLALEEIKGLERMDARLATIDHKLDQKANVRDVEALEQE